MARPPRISLLPEIERGLAGESQGGGVALPGPRATGGAGEASRELLPPQPLAGDPAGDRPTSPHPGPGMGAPGDQGRARDPGPHRGADHQGLPARSGEGAGLRLSHPPRRPPGGAGRPVRGGHPPGYIPPLLPAGPGLPGIGRASPPSGAGRPKARKRAPRRPPGERQDHPAPGSRPFGGGEVSRGGGGREDGAERLRPGETLL